MASMLGGEIPPHQAHKHAIARGGEGAKVMMECRGCGGSVEEDIFQPLRKSNVSPTCCLRKQLETAPQGVERTRKRPRAIPPSKTSTAKTAHDKKRGLS